MIITTIKELPVVYDETTKGCSAVNWQNSEILLPEIITYKGEPVFMDDDQKILRVSQKGERGFQALFSSAIVALMSRGQTEESVVASAIRDAKRVKISSKSKWKECNGNTDLSRDEILNLVKFPYSIVLTVGGGIADKNTMYHVRDLLKSRFEDLFQETWGDARNAKRFLDDVLKRYSHGKYYDNNN